LPIGSPTSGGRPEEEDQDYKRGFEAKNPEVGAPTGLQESTYN